MFEIHQLGDSQGIIHIHMDQNMLFWDFPLGSSYDLCAIFDRRNGKTLQDLQMAGAHPFLFHKRLKTSCIFLPELYPEGFLLFPALIRDGTLHIGNQIHGQAAILPANSKSVQIQIVCFRKHFFRESLITVNTYTFRDDGISNVTTHGITFLYYQIFRNKYTDGVVYSLPVTSDTVQIMIHPGDSIQFFKDISCKEPLHSGEKANV